MLVLWNCTLTLYAVCPSEISTLEYRQEYESKTATRCDHLPVRIPNCKSSILWTLSCCHLINSICQHQIGIIMSMSQYGTILILMNHEVLFEPSICMIQSTYMLYGPRLSIPRICNPMLSEPQRLDISHLRQSSQNAFSNESWKHQIREAQMI